MGSENCDDITKNIRTQVLLAPPVTLVTQEPAMLIVVGRQIQYPFSQTEFL